MAEASWSRGRNVGGQPRELVIEAGLKGSQYWADLWSYRELLYFLAWRDILVRYKQTAIGIAWAVLQPLLLMMVFWVVFGKLAKLPSAGVPYPLLVLSGMVPWLFFAHAFADSGSSVVGNANLVSKIYFPRVVIPLSAVVVCVVDFLISFGLLLAMLAWFGQVPDWRVALLPLFLLLGVLAAFGAGLWVAALNVKYRDFRYVVPFLVQIGMYASPVGFSSSLVPDKWRLVYALNPMVGVIDGFRWSILAGKTPLFLPGLVVSASVSVLLLAAGVAFFRRTERRFADLI